AMRSGDFEGGCPKLAESYRLDPRAGGLFTLAECENKEGKIASASAHYEDYLRQFDAMTPEQRDPQPERAGAATKALSSLRALVPTITIIPPANAPPGLVIQRDDTVLSGPSLGVALPVDPGKHVVTARSPAGTYRTRVVSIGTGESARVELGELPEAPG